MNKYLLKEVELFGYDSEKIEEILEDILLKEYQKSGDENLYWRNRNVRDVKLILKDLKKVKNIIKSLKILVFDNEFKDQLINEVKEDLKKPDTLEFLDMSPFYEGLKQIEDATTLSAQIFEVLRINTFYFQNIKKLENGYSNLDIFNERVELVKDWVYSLRFELFALKNDFEKEFGNVEIPDIEKRRVLQYKKRQYQTFIYEISLIAEDVNKKFRNY